MDNLPKRSDKIYQEIEEFEEYELTQCVVYEMAIRNEDVQKIIHSMKNTKFPIKIIEPSTNEQINVTLFNYSDVATLIHTKNI